MYSPLYFLFQFFLIERLINDEDTSFVKDIIWKIIFQLQLFASRRSPLHNKPYSSMRMQQQTKTKHNFQHESDQLLEWVNGELPRGVKPVHDWSTSWMDGLAMCHLINALRPGTISHTDINQSVREIRARAAFEGAGRTMGVPDLILPHELVGGTGTGKLKEEVLITYVAFLRDFSNTDSTNQKHVSQQRVEQKTREQKNSHDSNFGEYSSSQPSVNERTHRLTSISSNIHVYTTSGIPYQFNRVIAFGSGLRWGQVGKPSEFILQIRPDANLSDLSVSIECQPFELLYTNKQQNLFSHHRPQLHIKPLDWKRNMVRYTPTSPGNYSIGITYMGRHILNSPFCVRIDEVTNIDYGTMIEEFHIHPTSSLDVNQASSGMYQTSTKNTNQVSLNEAPYDGGSVFTTSSNVTGKDSDSEVVNKGCKNKIPSLPINNNNVHYRTTSSNNTHNNKDMEFVSLSHDSRHDSAFVDDDSLRSFSLSSSSEFMTASAPSSVEASVEYDGNSNNNYIINSNKNNDHKSYNKKSNFALSDQFDRDLVEESENDQQPHYLDNSTKTTTTHEKSEVRVQNFKIYGAGLRTGEVGCLSKFHVHTPTYFVDNQQSIRNGTRSEDHPETIYSGKMQGPLGVSITCPAVSIPVPFVRTKFSADMLEHQVVYVPTEPGIYELSVTWGKEQICGSPFRLTVSECVTGNDGHSYSNTVPPVLGHLDKNTNNTYKLSVYRDSEKFDFFLYYNASSCDPAQHQRKEVLGQLLNIKSPKNTVYCVPMDIELSPDEREFLLERANFDELPFVFVNNEYFGSYDNLMRLNSTNSLQRFLADGLSKLRTKLKKSVRV